MVPDRFNEVVRQAQVGEAWAQEELLQVLRPYVEQLARGLAASPRASRSASDLVQESLVRIWQRLDQFAGHEDDEQSWAMFCAWVGQIMRRLHLNEQRDRGAKRRRPPRRIASLQDGGKKAEDGNPGLDLPSADPTASTSAQQNEQAERIRAALDRLGDDPAIRVVRMHFFEGLSLRVVEGDALDGAQKGVRMHFFEGLLLREVAERLQVSYDKARQLFRSGMQHLEQELGPLR